MKEKVRHMKQDVAATQKEIIKEKTQKALLSSRSAIEGHIAELFPLFKKTKINPHAIPAWGYVNGGLDWKTVGPMIYQHLLQLDIPVELYLPNQKIAKKYLEDDYLMSEPKKITDF